MVRKEKRRRPGGTRPAFYVAEPGQMNFEDKRSAETTRPYTIAVELELLLTVDRCPCFGHNAGFAEIHNLPR